MSSSISDVVESITEYIEIKTEQVKLKIISRVAKMLSGIISFSLLAGIGLFFIFFLSFALALLLNEAFDSAYLGFFLIAGFYLLFIVVILILVKTKKIQGWLEQLILKTAEKDEQDD